MGYLLRWVTSCLLFLLLGSSSVLAGPTSTMESLLMPGEVSQAHARYEKECNKCHENFRKASQTKLCLDCHKDIARDVKEKT